MSSDGERPSSFVQPVSQPSEEKAPKGKIKVCILPNGSVLGEPGTKWNSRVEDLIRTYIPINYKEWRHVPQHFKDDVWRVLMGEFEFNVPPEVARPLLIKTWSQRYRTFKNCVRPYLKSDDPFGVGPPGVDPNIWKEFVQNEMDPKKKLQKTKNSENRKKLEYSHTLGRCTYANKLHQKKEKEPEKEFKRVDSWFMAHEREDGSVLKSAKQKYDQVKEACKKRQNTSTDGEGSSSIYDIGNDELTEVFGKDTNGGVRAVGSHISKKQLIHLGIADAHAEQKNKAKEDVSNVVF